MTGIQKIAASALAITFLALGVWLREGRNVAPSHVERMPTLQDISADQWQLLATRRIYFGHQSVGAEIVQGLKDALARNPQIGLSITRMDPAASVPAHALVESFVGQNGDTKSKDAAFASAVDNGAGAQGGVVMYKYCFVDFQPGTDPQKMFDQYRTTVETVRAKHPDATIVHITAPLTTVEPLWKLAMKVLLRRPSARDLNVKRNIYNDRLRKQYGGKDPIFDLAEVESTRADGSRTFFVTGGSPVYTLAPEYTYDGGHLNAVGRRAAAEQLLITLATLGKPSTTAARTSR